jgi:hypothetical protein
MVIRMRGYPVVAERRRGLRQPARGMPRARDFWFAVSVGVLLSVMILVGSSW